MLCSFGTSTEASAHQVVLSVINTVTRADTPDGLVTLEYVAVTIRVAHVCRGSLEVTLTSPTPTHSTLITPRRYDTYVTLVQTCK